MAPEPRNRQRGGALVMVLWTALLLSAILAGALAAVRIEARIAAARADKIKAYEAARSALEIAAFDAASADGGARNTISGRRLSLNGYEVTIEPAQASKKLDINLASETMLANFFAMLGEEPENATSLAARIADWRDEDNLARPNGAEKSDYGAARNSEKIGNRPFRSVSELRLVLDMPHNLLACAAPALTVLGDDGAPDPQLLAKLYNRSMHLPQQTRRTRLATSGRQTRSGQRFAYTATARSQNGREFRLTGLFRITGGQTPYEFIAVFPATPEPAKPTCAGLDGGSVRHN